VRGLLRGVDDNLRLALKIETSVRAYRAPRGFWLVVIDERLCFLIERRDAAAVGVLEPRAHRAQRRFHPRALPPQPLAAGVVQRPSRGPDEVIARRIKGPSKFNSTFHSTNEGLKRGTVARAKASVCLSNSLNRASLHYWYTQKRLPF